MTEQKEQIKLSAEYIKALSPFNQKADKQKADKQKADTAIIVYKDSALLKEFITIKKIKYADIPPVFNPEDELKGDFIFASDKKGKKNFYVLSGFLNFYNGYKMREAAHPVYVLKELGVKNLLVIDEVGFLNPRFKNGGVAFIYDHINLMGDNPLIGENDDTIGTRFPDMSEPYDEKWYKNNTALFRDYKFEVFPSVYLGVTGPETETEAECRFYRDTGSDVLGYSLVPLNIAAVHAKLKCAAFGMISRELVADRLKEITEDEKLNNRRNAEKAFAPLLAEILINIK